jgi:hypothetical protein
MRDRLVTSRASEKITSVRGKSISWVPDGAIFESDVRAFGSSLRLTNQDLITRAVNGN